MIVPGARARRRFRRFMAMIVTGRRVGVGKTVMRRGTTLPMLYAVHERRYGAGQAGRQTDNSGEYAKEEFAGHGLNIVGSVPQREQRPDRSPVQPSWLL